jgi:hypothetical protein
MSPFTDGGVSAADADAADAAAADAAAADAAAGCIGSYYLVAMRERSGWHSPGQR